MLRDAPAWQQGGGNSAAAAVVAVAVWRQCSAWQRGGGVKLVSAAAASSLAAGLRIAASLLHHWDMAALAATNAVLPPRAAAVVMKTPAATAMAGAQTINNQLKTQKRRRWQRQR
jgi:hypothetical protein